MFPGISHYQNSSSSSGWIGPKFGQRMARHYSFANYNLNYQNPMSVAGGTAGSVNFDGPSMPSENCISSCSSTTHPIGLDFVYFSSTNTHLRCLNEICGYDFGVLSKWQGKTPKWHNRQLFSCIGALPPMQGAVTNWEPFQSEYFLIFGDFSGISFHGTAAVSVDMITNINC